MKLKHFSLIISISGILILYSLSKFSQTPIIDIKDIDKYEGKKVTIDGLVTEYYLTKYGSQVINLFNHNSTMKIFSDIKTNVEYGDNIRVTGEVQKYNGDWSIVVNDNRGIELIKKWDNLSVPLWQLAENPTGYLNLNVNVTGYVEFVSNSNFYLVDNEKKHALLIEYSQTKNLTISPGQKINALGKFIFDSENFRYKLVICDEKHDIVSICD